MSVDVAAEKRYGCPLAVVKCKGLSSCISHTQLQCYRNCTDAHFELKKSAEIDLSFMIAKNR